MKRKDARGNQMPFMTKELSIEGSEGNAFL